MAAAGQSRAGRLALSQPENVLYTCCMSKKLLKESAASKLTVLGNRWRAVLAKSGQGSSGYYSEEVLREFGPQALAPGAHCYVGHPTEQNPGRNLKDLVGTYPDGAVYEEGVGLVGELEVLPHWKDFVEAVAEHSALSIYMMGEADEEGRVTSLLKDRQNAVDMVSYGGLEGSRLTNKLYESAIAHSDKARVEASAEKQENGKPMEEKLDKLIALFGTFVTESKTAAEAAVKAEADADAPEKVAAAAVEAYRVADKAITTAGLLESQVESLRTAAIAGADVAPLIESAKKIVAEFAALAESQAAPAGGRVVESGASDLDFEFSGYGVRK